MEEKNTLRTAAQRRLAGNENSGSGYQTDVATTEPLARTVRLSDKELLIAVSGELDLHSVGPLQDALEAATEESNLRVVVDLRDVALVDSISLGVLAGAARRLRERGGALGVVASDAEVVRAFEITSLDRVIPVETTTTALFERLRAATASPLTPHSEPRHPTGRAAASGQIGAENTRIEIVRDGYRADVSIMEPTVRIDRLAEKELLISVSGELDLHSVGRLQDALDGAVAETGEVVVVDLGEVDLIDSIALGALARASRRLRESSGALGVAASNADVVRAFEITSLDRVIPIASTTEEVLRRLRAASL